MERGSCVAFFFFLLMSQLPGPSWLAQGSEGTNKAGSSCACQPKASPGGSYWEEVRVLLPARSPPIVLVFSLPWALFPENPVSPPPPPLKCPNLIFDSHQGTDPLFQVMFRLGPSTGSQ